MSLKANYIDKYGDLPGAIFRPGFSGPIMELLPVSHNTQPIIRALNDAGIQTGLRDRPSGHQSVTIIGGSDSETVFKAAVDVLERKGLMIADTAEEVRGAIPNAVENAMAHRPAADMNQGRGASR